MSLVRESLLINECGKGLHDRVPGTSTWEVNLLPVYKDTQDCQVQTKKKSKGIMKVA